MAAPFPIDPHLTSIAIAYRNGSLIADSVLPRVPVGKSEFKWWEYDLADGFTLPNTSVGRTSQPNQVEFNATEETSSTSDYALDSPYRSRTSIMRRKIMILWVVRQSKFLT
ncbi:hypothetical protein [Pectobacterium aroidearum]|uniref:hypothetical protein n=1 Tax=Pectobacterium aroidearum TaxID=1201031 RepID=UPI0021150111|nr:hypothetical protein [Pectobacterium aroidearum]UUE75476.1 hypothetical protein L0Y20_03590 [Pectobacterium aroidearum]